MSKRGEGATHLKDQICKIAFDRLLNTSKENSKKFSPEAVNTGIVALVAIKIVLFVTVDISVFAVFQFFELFGHL